MKKFGPVMTFQFKKCVGAVCLNSFIAVPPQERDQINMGFLIEKCQKAKGNVLLQSLSKVFNTLLFIYIRILFFRHRIFFLFTYDTLQYNTLLTILLTYTTTTLPTNYIHYFRYLQSWLLTKLQYFPYIIRISFL